MTDFDWAPHRPSAGGEFVKFVQIGDQVTGTVAAIRTHKFDEDEGPVPLIDIEPRGGGDLVTLSVNKVDLRKKLTDCSPQVGDDLRVRYAGNEKAGAGTKKVFEVQHRRADQPPIRDEADLSEFSETPF